MNITSFQGKHRWLSNFWPAPVQLDGRTFPSIEHAYQAAKFPEDQRAPLTVCSAGEAKRYGRRAKLPRDWHATKLNIMRQLIEQKFAPGTELAQQLKDTAPSLLVEGNTWGDRYWGMCDGTGANHLGKLLMAQRDALP